MLGQKLIIACIVPRASFCSCIMPGPAISLCHKELSFLTRLFGFLVL